MWFNIIDIWNPFLPRYTYRFIYIRAKATSLLTYCIFSDLCIYTTATAAATNIKEKNRFRVHFRSNINEPQSWVYVAFTKIVSRWMMNLWKESATVDSEFMFHIFFKTVHFALTSIRNLVIDSYLNLQLDPVSVPHRIQLLQYQHSLKHLLPQCIQTS